jgi:outer membrane protein assembly factor BamB
MRFSLPQHENTQIGRYSSNHITLPGGIAMNHRKFFKFAVLLSIILSCSTSVWAKPVSSDTALAVARTWLIENPAPMEQPQSGETWMPKGVRPFTNETGEVIAHIVDLNPEGFIVVPADDTVEPILAFSTTGHFAGSLDPNEGLSAIMLKDIPDRVKAAHTASNRHAPVSELDYHAHVASVWQHLTETAGTQNVSSSSIFESDAVIPVVNPLISDTWNQTSPYNSAIPHGAPYTGGAAMAMGMIIHYFQYPASASGTNTVYFYGSAQTVSFSDTYNYSQMPASLTIPYPTGTQIQAVSKLLYDCGIASGTDYEVDGSGAWLNNAAYGFTSYFHYSSAYSVSDVTSSWQTVWQNELSAGFPVLFATEGNGTARAMTCDGWGTLSGSPVFHINLGMGGTYNAWYTVPGFTAAGNTWTILDSYIYNIRSTMNHISGSVTTQGGAALSGVSLTAPGVYTTATTNSTGSYNLAVGTGFNGAVTPSAPGYTFSPPSMTYTNVRSDLTQQNYVGTQHVPPSIGFTSPTFGAAYSTQSQTLSISGTASADAGLTITKVTWSNASMGSGVCTGTTTWTAVGIQLSPGTNSIVVTATDSTGNQSKATLVVTYTPFYISGYLITKPGIIPSMFEIDAGSSNWAYPDSTGFYQLAVTSGWSGTVMPYRTGFTFLPPSANFTNVTSNLTQNFTAVINTYAMTGSVTLSDGTPLPGTLMTSSDGNSVTTDANGNYQMNVNYGWTGTITPSCYGCSFSPTSESYSYVTANQTQNYVASSLPPAIAVTSPSSTGVWYSSDQTVSVSGSAVAGEGCSITGVTWTNSNGGSGTCAGITSWNIPQLNLQSGANLVTVTATDNSGRTGSSSLAVYCYQPGPGTVWPMFHHDLLHSSLSPLTGPNSPAVKWTMNIGSGSKAASSVAIGQDNTIYVGVNDSLCAINPDGTQKWAINMGAPVYLCPAIGTDGTIYEAADDCKLHAITSSGVEKWAFNLAGAYSQGYEGDDPVIGLDGTIYILASDENLYAVNPDGTEKWAYNVWNQTSGSPVVGQDGTAYIQYCSILAAIDANGNKKWSFTTDGSLASTPTIGRDGTVYLPVVVNNGLIGSQLYAVNPDGTERWMCLLGGNCYSSPAIGSDGTVYVGSGNGDLNAVTPDGNIEWAFQAGAGIDGSPVIDSAGTIYVGSWDNNFYALAPDGSKKWAFTTGGHVSSSPAIGADGTIYMISNDGNLYAIGPATMHGVVNLKYYIGDVTTIPVTVALRNSGSTTAFETHAVVLNTDSSYSFALSTAGLSGTYNAWAKASHWLAEAVPFTLDSNGNGTASFSLINGDVNGDNFVEDQDYSLMGAAWYSVVGDSNYNVNADLNGDGAVEDQDYSIMGAAWYQEGDQ